MEIPGAKNETFFCFSFLTIQGHAIRQKHKFGPTEYLEKKSASTNQLEFNNWEERDKVGGGNRTR